MWVLLSARLFYYHSHMKQIILILACISLTLLSCSNNKKYKEQLEELNKELPKGTNLIQIDKMEVVDNTFYCHYTILADMPQEPTDEEMKQAREMLLNSIKSDPSFKVFKDDNLNFCFTYKSKEGNAIMEVKFTPKEYE